MASSAGATQNGCPSPVRMRRRRTISPGPVDDTAPMLSASRRLLSMTDRSQDPRLAVTVLQPSLLATSRSGNVPTGTMLKPGWRRSRSTRRSPPRVSGNMLMAPTSDRAVLVNSPKVMRLLVPTMLPRPPSTPATALVR